MDNIQITKECSHAGDYDVIVCGGGPAGVCAAIASTRQGAKTLLIERNGELGGFWTSGLLSWIADVTDKTGVVKEIVDKLRQLGDGREELRDKYYFTADTETTKIVFEKMCSDAGVDIRLYTLVTGVVKDNNRITGVVADSKSGCEYFGAGVVIDATGDGDVGALAGCTYEMGNEQGQTQPMSMIVLVSGITYDDIEAMYASDTNVTKNSWICNEIRRGGFEPSYVRPLLAPVSKENNLFALMANHEYGVSALSADDLTQATIHGRAEVYECVKALRSLGGIWKDIHVVTSAPNIGVREGRRIHGMYRLCREEDAAKGLSHHDAVCRVTYNMDIHQLSANIRLGEEKWRKGMSVYPYDIPLRSLISDEVDGLMMAGRCISGDFYTYGNYRVGGNAARTGEAAGLAAGYSVVNKVELKKMPEIIKDLLEKSDKA